MSLVDSEGTWYLQRLAPLIRRELPASVHYHECPFLFILDKIEPLTLQSDLSLRSNTSHHLGITVGPVFMPWDPPFTFCGDLILLCFSRQRSLVFALLLATYFLWGELVAVHASQKGEAFQFWGWGQLEQPDFEVAVQISWHLGWAMEPFNPGWSRWGHWQGRPMADPAAFLFPSEWV